MRVFTQNLTGCKHSQELYFCKLQSNIFENCRVKEQQKYCPHSEVRCEPQNTEHSDNFPTPELIPTHSIFRQNKSKSAIKSVNSAINHQCQNPRTEIQTWFHSWKKIQMATVITDSAVKQVFTQGKQLSKRKKGSHLPALRFEPKHNQRVYDLLYS